MRIILLIIGVMFLQNKIFAEDTITTTSDQTTTATTTATPDADKIIEYLNTVINIKNTADSEYIMAPSPRDPIVQKNYGVAANNLEKSLPAMLENKELLDIGFAAYVQGRPGETISPDPYTDFIDKHKGLFCSPTSGIESQAFPECSSKNKSAVTEYGDIKLSGLLSPTKYDPAQQVIAEEVIRNLINPFPSSQLADLINDKSKLEQQENKEKFGNLFADQAALTAARYSLNEMFAMRVPTKGNNETGPVSIMQILESESNARFKTPEWYEKVSTASLESLMRELVQMEAFRLWMDYHRLKSSHRQEVLTAILLANTVNKSKEQAKLISESVPVNPNL